MMWEVAAKAFVMMIEENLKGAWNKLGSQERWLKSEPLIVLGDNDTSVNGSILFEPLDKEVARKVIDLAFENVIADMTSEIKALTEGKSSLNFEMKPIEKDDALYVHFVFKKTC